MKRKRKSKLEQVAATESAWSIIRGELSPDHHVLVASLVYDQKTQECQCVVKADNGWNQERNRAVFEKAMHEVIESVSFDY